MKTFKICTTNTFGVLNTITEMSSSLALTIVKCAFQYGNNIDIVIFDCEQSRFVAHKPYNEAWNITPHLAQSGR
jgi:hypothetical protein